MKEGQKEEGRNKQWKEGNKTELKTRKKKDDEKVTKKGSVWRSVTRYSFRFIGWDNGGCSDSRRAIFHVLGNHTSL